MAISPIEFGKNLRPSTVDAMNKINEVVSIVNSLDPDGIAQIKEDVSTLQTQMQTANGNISTLQGSVSANTSNISKITESVNANTQDLENIKTTLYTPLESKEGE